MTTKNSFVDEVRRHFGPLAEDLGLAPDMTPSRTGMPSLSYRDDKVEYQVCLDAGDKQVITLVYVHRDGSILGAELPELVAAAGLGPPQSVKTGGQTRRAISLSLASQADWARRLHHLLISDGAPNLFHRM
jgi:hypothetical protein